VIENYKGAYTENTISVETNIVGSGGCGLTVDYGDTLNVVAYKNSEGITSNGVSVCNIVSDEFAEKVRKEIKNPNEAYNSVETNSWQQFHKSNSQTFYADTKRVTKDEYGSYIWILLNDATTSKSQKTRLHFACKEKMFTIEHEVSFSEFDAKGKVLTASNFGRQEQYQWLPLTDVYSKLLSYTC
jgi:DNA gyrase/topoisomerase IV subunit B